MAFIIQGSTLLTMATQDDLVAIDQRLFEQNEGLTDDYVEDQLIRSTERILSLLRSSEWWQTYYMSRSSTALQTLADVPALVGTKIKGRQNDFSDLCCYYALYNYILPNIADFGNEDAAERKKMGYYQQKFTDLFGELIQAGDWYDFSGDGTIASSEKSPGVWNLRRVR